MILMTSLLLLLSRISANETLLPAGDSDLIKNNLWLPHNVGTCDSTKITEPKSFLPKPTISYTINQKYLSENLKTSKYVASPDFDQAEPDTRAVLFQCRAPYPIEVIYEETLNSSFRNPTIENERILHQKYEPNSNVRYFISLQFHFGHIASVNNLHVQCSSIQNPCWGQTAEIKYDPSNQTILVKLEGIVVNFNNNTKIQEASATNISTLLNSAAQVYNNKRKSMPSSGNTLCKAYFYYRANTLDKVSDIRNEYACKLKNGNPGKVEVHPFLSLTSIVRSSFRNQHIQPSRCWKKLNWDAGVGNVTCQNCSALEVNTLRPQIFVCNDPINSNLLTKSQNEPIIGSFVVFGLRVLNYIQIDEITYVEPIFPDEDAKIESLVHIGEISTKDFVVNTTVRVGCLYSAYYFVPPFGFAAEYKSAYTNESQLDIHPFTTEGARRHSAFDVYAARYIVEINSTRLSRFYCIGFLKRQAKWVNISFSVNAYEPIKPQILNDIKNDARALEGEIRMLINNSPKTYEAPDSTVTNIYLNSNDENKTINCSAFGFPSPNITWILHDNTFKATANGRAKNLRNLTVPCKLVWSAITFSKVTAETEGDYICKAANPFGVTHKIFRVSVNASSYETVIYAVIASAAGVIFVFGTILLIQLRKVRKQEGLIRNLTEDEIQEFFKGNESMHPTDYHFDVFSQAFNASLEIAKENIILEEKLLGSGQFGTVTKGYLFTTPERSTDEDDAKQMNNYCNARLVVAVKTVKCNVDVTHVKSLLSEIKIMAYLDSHPNIVQLLGTMTENIQRNEVLMAVEFCEYGDLQHYLEKHRNGFENLFFNTKSKNSGYANLAQVNSITEERQNSDATRLTKIPQAYLRHSTKDMLEWAKGIANGIVYLGHKKIIHGDLAARNILLSDRKVAKISDFGLSRQLLKDYTVYSKKTETPLPWKWLAIESLKYQTFSLKSDVWSFGVVLWEIFSVAEVPYPGFYFNQEFMDKIEQGYRLPEPEFSNKDLYDLMMCCWEAAPEKRPQAGYIFQTLCDIAFKLN